MTTSSNEYVNATLLSIMIEQDKVAMIFEMDEWTNSDTKTEKKSKPAKKQLELSLKRSKPDGCQWQYVMAFQLWAFSVQYVLKNANASTSLAVFSKCQAGRIITVFEDVLYIESTLLNYSNIISYFWQAYNLQGVQVG